MTNPDWNWQVKIGRGRSDTGAHHRAIEIARQLLAIGRWPDHLNTLIVIHDAYDLHRQLQLSGCGVYNADHNVTVYPAVYELEAGRDYEIVAMSDSFRQLHDL
jgi:hypothetical protein